MEDFKNLCYCTETCLPNKVIIKLRLLFVLSTTFILTTRVVAHTLPLSFLFKRQGETTRQGRLAMSEGLFLDMLWK